MTEQRYPEMANGTAPLTAAHPGGLMVVVCSLGKVRIEWAISFALQPSPFGIGRHTLFIPNKTTIEARNLAVQAARSTQSKYLMFWDDDMIPQDRFGLERLYTTMSHNPQIDVLGGVYPIRRDIASPIVVKDKGATEPYWGWQDGKAHRVFMVGTGFMMIRMESFEDIDLPWFDDSQLLSDDYFFAEICQDKGKRIYVDGSVVCDQMNLDGKRFNVNAARGTEVVEDEPGSNIAGMKPAITTDGVRIITG